MGVKRTIIWAIVALLIGVALGFGARTPIANVLGLDAQISPPPVWGKPSPEAIANCQPPKIWTGNGCADTSGWTPGDWWFFYNCVRLGGSEASCAQQTEKGKGRR